MKKILSLILCGFMCCTLLTGCGGKENNESNDPTDVNKEENKINLNDNIEVSIETKSTSTADHFFYMFVTNLQDVFPNADIKSNDNYSYVSYWVGNEEDTADGEISEEGLQNNFDLLKFDSDLEEKITNVFNKYQNNTYAGIKDVEYVLDNHCLTYTYQYITFKNSDYNSEGDVLNQEVEEILQDSTRFNGPYGGFDHSEEVILTEELCSEYHLECDRW